MPRSDVASSSEYKSVSLQWRSSCWTVTQLRPLETTVLNDFVETDPSAFLTERVRLTCRLRSLARAAGAMSGE